jgi:hypothetical protein
MVRQNLDGLPRSQWEDLTEALQTLMRHGGWTRRQAAEAMDRLTPYSFPSDDDPGWGPLIRTFPWVAHLDETERRQFVSEIMDAMATPVEGHKPGGMTDLLARWRERAAS